MARTRKTPKPKLPTYTRIERTSEPQMYDLLDSLVKKDRPELKDAVIALAWRQGWKRDKDGGLVLGKCKKASELDKQFHAFDFVIILNKEMWANLDAGQRRALMHHELLHGDVSLDQNGNVKTDARGRTCFRVRKHDLEEFREIVSKYGCYKQDIEDFCLAAMKSKKPPQPQLPLMDGPATIPMASAAKETKAKGRVIGKGKTADGTEWEATRSAGS